MESFIFLITYLEIIQVWAIQMQNHMIYERFYLDCEKCSVFWRKCIPQVNLALSSNLFVLKENFLKFSTSGF